MSVPSRKIPKITIKNVYKSVQDLQELVSETEQVNYQFCPFTIILGEINTTNNGYRDNYSIPNDYSNFAKVFSGDEAVISVWNKSYTLTQNNPPLPQNPTDNDFEKYYGTKTFKLGEVFRGLLINDNLGIDFTPSPQNSNFTEEQVVKHINLLVPNNSENEDFINKITEYIFNLYIIPKVNSERITKKEILNPFNDVDKQWYYIQSITKIWNKQEKKVAYANISFVSLNDKIAQSGLAINQYVQTGGPGEPYAFPKLDDNDNIILDRDRLTALPITHAQVTFYGTAAVSNIALMGRPIINLFPTKTYTIYPPRLLFPFTYQCSIYDRISLKAVPSNNYYMIWGDYTIDSYFTNWRDNIAERQLYDETNTKIFEGHLRSSKSDAHNSNPPTNIQLPYWDNNFLNNSNWIPDGQESNIQPKTNWLFNYVDFKNNRNATSLTNQQFDYKTISNKNLAHYNLFNFALYSTIYQIPLNVRQTTPITLNTLPIVGGFLNKLFAGVPIGFKTATSSLPDIRKYALLFPCSVYDTISDTLYAEQSDLSIIPLNVFDQTPDKINALLGTTSQTTAFCFQVTDKIKANKYDNNGKVANSEEIISTRELGQWINNGVYLLDETSQLQQKTILNSGFIIDAITFQSLGKVEYSIAFFSKPNGANSPVEWNDCVWIGKYKSLSYATNNTRTWTEIKQLSDPTFNFNEIFNYPQDIKPPNGELTIDYSNEINNDLLNNCNLKWNFDNGDFNNGIIHPDNINIDNNITKATFIKNQENVLYPRNISKLYDNNYSLSLAKENYNLINVEVQVSFSLKVSQTTNNFTIQHAIYEITAFGAFINGFNSYEPYNDVYDIILNQQPTSYNLTNENKMVEYSFESQNNLNYQWKSTYRGFNNQSSTLTYELGLKSLDIQISLDTTETINFTIDNINLEQLSENITNQFTSTIIIYEKAEAETIYRYFNLAGAQVVPCLQVQKLIATYLPKSKK